MFQKQDIEVAKGIIEYNFDESMLINEYEKNAT
jgi:hypothetical protein